MFFYNWQETRQIDSQRQESNGQRQEINFLHCGHGRPSHCHWFGSASTSQTVWWRCQGNPSSCCHWYSSEGKIHIKNFPWYLLRSVSSGCRGNVPLPLRRGLSPSLQTNKEGPWPWPRQHCQPSRGQTLDGSTIDSLWLGSLWPGWRGHCHRERSVRR